MIRRLIKFSESVLHRILGVCGGLVCAFALGLVVYYIVVKLGGSLFWLLAATVISVPLFSLLGLCLFRYFALFFMPVFNFVSNGEIDDDGNDLPSFIRFGVSVGFLFALAALASGAVFQLDLVFALGMLLFLAYAFVTPKVFAPSAGKKSNIKA